MPDEPRRTLPHSRHIPWEQNPSDQWAFALECLERGAYEQAIKHCEQAIDIWPTYYDAWLLLASANEELERYDEALRAVQRASEIAIEELSQAWNNLASLHLARGEWEEALTVDRILDVIDPTRHAIIGYRRAISYTQLGDLDSALKWLQEAIAYQPDLLDRALAEVLLAPLHDRLTRLQNSPPA